MPNMSESLLATFFALLGGPVAAIAYRGVLLGFEWFSPILPSLSWVLVGFLGTVAPLVGFMIVEGRYRPTGPAAEGATTAARPGPRVLRLAGSTLLAGFALALIPFILLNMGFIGFKSLAVVSGSMAPAINEGDLVIVKQVPLEQLDVGDIISYRRGGIDVIHRIVSMDHGKDGLIWTNKGDANPTVDRPGPAPGEIRGKVVQRIPHAGRFAFWARSAHDS